MADFDAIYEDDDDSDTNLDEDDAPRVQEPIVIRGAGNMTV